MKGGVSEWDDVWSSADYIKMINNGEKDKHNMLKEDNIELIYRLQLKYTKSPEKRCRDMEDIIKKIGNQKNDLVERNLKKLLYIINNLARYKISTETRELGNISPMSSTNEMDTKYAECSSLNMPIIDTNIAIEVKKQVMREYGNSYTVNKGRYNEERIKPEEFFPEVIIP